MCCVVLVNKAQTNLSRNNFILSWKGRLWTSVDVTGLMWFFSFLLIMLMCICMKISCQYCMYAPAFLFPLGWLFFCCRLKPTHLVHSAAPCSSGRITAMLQSLPQGETRHSSIRHMGSLSAYAASGGRIKNPQQGPTSTCGNLGEGLAMANDVSPAKIARPLR